jgi:hypothetical protein
MSKETAMSGFKTVALFAALAALGCNGKKETREPAGDGTGDTGDTANTGDKGAPAASDPSAVYGPLEKGADYQSWTKLNKTPVKSKTHGNRWVDTYVNTEGVEAFKNDDADIPMGAVIVKTSFESAADGSATDVPGPIFVMARVDNDGEPGWWYGLHWESVPDKWQKAMGGAQAYWRTPSKKVDYCSDCHDNYPREIGGIPKDARAY